MPLLEIKQTSRGSASASRTIKSRSLIALPELQQHKILFGIRDTVSDVYFAIDAVVSLVIPLSVCSACSETR